MFRILLALSVLALVACASNPLCPAAKEAAHFMATKAAAPDAFNCDAPEEIEKDIVAVLPKANICSASMIGDVICPPIVEKLAQGALAQLPARYKCHGGLVGDRLKAKAEEICRKSI